VRKQSIEQIQQIVERISNVPSLTKGARVGIERIARMNWIEEIDALAKLWRFCPDLVEQYLDVMICEMHDFPEPAPAKAVPPGPAKATEAETSRLN
jgi:hypothetical protein